MKIAILAPLDESIPPVAYGGTELIVSELTESLVKKGYNITLYASGDSVTHANLVPGCKKSLRSDNFSQNPIAAHLLMIDKVISESGNYDLIHSHLGWRFLPFVKYSKAPVLNTYHAPYSHPRVKFIFEKFKDLNYTALSKNHAKNIDLNFLGIVYNGIEVVKYSFDDTPKKDKLIFIGRYSLQKGAEEALRLAFSFKKTITTVAKIEKDQPEGYRYYSEKIEPLLKNELVENLGEVGFEEKLKALSMARAFIFPVNWEEPFGLVLVEAMACGTPVVAYARGAIPEIVKDGETGFIVNSSDSDIRGDWIIKKTGFDGLCEAVERIYNMPQEEYIKMRRNCRRLIEDKFTVEKMVDNYEIIYQKIANNES